PGVRNLHGRHVLRHAGLGLRRAAEMIDQLLFRRFFTSLAIAWAVGEWILACWLLPPFRALPPALQLPALPAMALLNRLAACVFERESRLPARVGRASRMLMWVGVAAMPDG